ncbi:MAG: hypothetical protein V4739_12100 [Pseudomonadota bacterium]
MKLLNHAAFALIAATCATGALAQSNTAPTTPANPPAQVGVNPNEAAEANQKAVPRSDVGSVVRTGPSAPDKARNVVNETGNAARSAGDAVTPDAATTPRTVRAPKADRN